MLFDKNKQTENMHKTDISKNENDLVPVDDKPESIKRIIDGKLYDTSKATHICDLSLWLKEIPGYDFCFHHMLGEHVSLYKGNTEYFIVVYGDIKLVDEDWVKDILGQYSIEKYIELFGEPELA